MVKVNPNRQISRDGVNTTRLFFEHNGCTFQEVDQQQDFGKDAYVDIGDQAGVSPLCVALQIKSGASYSKGNGDYSLPVEQHADAWRKSTVPVFGIVHDPRDGHLRWVDLTGYLQAHPDHAAGNITVSQWQTLDGTTLRGAFTAAVRAYIGGGAGALTLALLSPEPFQLGAVYDAWALSRSDAKYLLILRRFIMDLKPEPLRRAIWLLSHVGSHPDIFWTKDNWIRPETDKQVLPSFRWSPEEIAHMLRAVDHSDYGRGTLGQCLDLLLYEDRAVVQKLIIAIALLLKDADTTQAIRAATLALTHSRDQRKQLATLDADFPNLREDEWFRDVAASVEESGNLSLY